MIGDFDQWKRASFGYRFLHGYLLLFLIFGALCLIMWHQYLNLAGFLALWILPMIPVIGVFELAVFLGRPFRRK